MLRDKGLIWFFLLVLALLLVPFLHADDEPGSSARIVRVSYVEGHVQVSHQQGGGYQNVTLNVPLVQGDIVRTGDDGWVEIQLENGSVIRLAPASQLTFSLLSRFPSGATATEVSLDDGEAGFAVAAGSDDGPFRVNVRGRTISPKRSSRFRITSDNSDPLEVVVWKGELGIFDRDASREVAVKSQEVFTLDPQDPDHYSLEKGAQADALDSWANQRDQYLTTFASNNTNVQAPYQYGISDMNYYGQYYNVTGCGYCWQPYGVGLNWDPFMNGYWDSCPGGFTWVSAYPWGWMPYRFGQWVFVPGFGWMWQPGLWNRWVRVPPVVHPPVGFKPPVPPAKAVIVAGAPVPGKPGVRFVDKNAVFTKSTDDNNRPVISNEHTPVRRASMGEAASSAQNGSQSKSVSDEHTPVKRMSMNGTISPGPDLAPSAGVDRRALRSHPPVETRTMALPPRVMNTPAPAVQVSAPPVSRPQSYAPAPRAYSPPVGASSAPPVAHTSSSTSSGTHR